MRALSALDQANELVRHLGDQIGIPSLALDEQARCLLLVGRRWALCLVLDAPQETLYLSCPFTAPEQLADIPPGAWVALLQAQHLGGRVQGASASVDPQGRVCLQQALPLRELPPSQLLAAVEALLGRAQQWSAQLARLQTGAGELPLPAAAPARLHHTRI